MRDGDIELAGDFLVEVELGECARERGVLLQRNAMFARLLDDALGDFAATFGDDARGTAPVVVERDGERSFGPFVHARRSTNRLARAPGSPAGMPCKHTTRSTLNPKSRNVSPSSEECVSRLCTSAGESARSWTETR